MSQQEVDPANLDADTAAFFEKVEEQKKKQASLGDQQKNTTHSAEQKQTSSATPQTDKKLSPLMPLAMSLMGVNTKIAAKRGDYGQPVTEVFDVYEGTMLGAYDALAETVNFLPDVANTVLGAEGEEKIPDILDPSGFKGKNVVSQLIHPISQFATGFIGAGKFLKAAKLLQGPGRTMSIQRGLAQGALADFTVFDANEKRLSNLIESNPILANPITQFLAATPDDTAALGRFKNALEGMALGIAGEAVFSIAKGIKASRAAKTVAEAEDILIKTSDELEMLAAQSKQTSTEPAHSVEAVISGDVNAATDALVEAGGKVEVKIHGVDGDSVADTLKYIVTQHPPTAAAKRLSPEEFGTLVENSLRKGGSIDDFIETEFMIGKGLSFKTVEEAHLHADFARKAQKNTLKGKGMETHEELRNKAPEWIERMGMQGVLDAAAANPKLMETLATQSLAYKMAAKSVGAELVQQWNHMLLHGKTPELLEEFTKLSRAYQDLSRASKDIATASGRSLSAGRIKADYLPPEIMAGVIKATGGEPEKVLKVLNVHQNCKAFDTIQEIVINGLLSSPKTHLVNTAGNILKTMLMPVEKMIGGVIMGNNAMVREGRATYAGLTRYLSDSWKMTKIAIKAGENILDAGHRINDTAFRPILGSYEKITADILTKRATSGHTGNTSLSVLEEIQARSMSLLGMPSRLLGGMDELFKQLNYRAHTYAKLTVEASSKFGNDTVKITEYIENGMRDAFESGGRGTRPDGLRYAQESTWTQSLRDDAYFGGGIGQGMSTLVKNYPPLRLVMPFIRTPTNLIRDFVAHTPGLNMVTKRYRDAIIAGGERAAHAYGQMATGTLLWASAITLATNGNITGGYPKDSATRQAWIDSGIEPYSFKIGDTYLSFARLDPFSTFFGIAADYAEYSRNWDDSAKGNWASGAILALSNNILSKSYLTGLTDLIDALGDQSVDSKAMQRYMQRSVTMFIPYSSGLRFTRQLTDDSMREVRGIFDSILNAIPGTSHLLPERNSWITGKGISHNLFWSTHKDDLVSNELANLGDNLSIGAPLKKLKGVELDGEEYARLCELQGIIKIGGLTQHQRLERLMKSRSYDLKRERMPDMPGDLDNPRTLMVEKILRNYRSAAQQHLLKERPRLQEKTNHQLKVRLAAKRGQTNMVKDLLTIPK